MTARLARLVTALFPPAFRARYGVELEATLAEGPVGASVVADLVLALARQWARAARPGSGPLEQRRRRAVATSFAAGVAGLVSLLVFARAVGDRPVPGLTGWALHLYDAGSVVVTVVGATAGAAAAYYWVRVVVAGARRRDRSTLVAALRPGALGAGWLVVGALLGRVAGRVGLSRSSSSGRAAGHLHLLGAGRHGVLVAFGALSVAAAAWCVRDARRAFAATRWGERELRVALGVARAAALVGDALAVTAVAVGVRALAVGGTGAWSGALAVSSLVALVGAAAVATVSSLGRAPVVRTP